MENLKPFDLERALAGNPVVTRDGRKVLKVAYCEKASPTTRVIAWLDNSIHSCDENGIHFSSALSHENDLFMAPRKKKLFIAVSNKPEEGSIEPHRTSLAYNSLESLKFCAMTVDKQIIEIEIDE